LSERAPFLWGLMGRCCAAGRHAGARCLSARAQRPLPRLWRRRRRRRRRRERGGYVGPAGRRHWTTRWRGRRRWRRADGWAGDGSAPVGGSYAAAGGGSIRRDGGGGWRRRARVDWPRARRRRARRAEWRAGGPAEGDGPSPQPAGALRPAGWLPCVGLVPAALTARIICALRVGRRHSYLAAAACCLLPRLAAPLVSRVFHDASHP
jgi:hypothetical protein